MLTQFSLEGGLLLDDLAQLLLGELEERAERLRRDELRAADEALPERRVRPDLLRDQPREQRRRDEAAQRAVRGDRLDDLPAARASVASVRARRAEGGNMSAYRAQEERREVRLVHELVHDDAQDLRAEDVGHREADGDGCARRMGQCRRRFGRQKRD